MKLLETGQQAVDRVPRVSVIIPAFNSESHIERTIHAVQAQSFSDFELIVVNDGSTDGTAEVIGKLRKNISIRLIEQKNRGISAALNKGVAAARGELIAFLDSDDLWHPQKLQRQVEYMDAHPAVALVNCYSALIDSNGHCLGWRFGSPAYGDVYRQMLKRDLVAGGSVPLIRKVALRSCGPFDETLLVRCDWDMWLRIARQFPFGTVPQTLVGYTRRSGSASHEYERMVKEGRRVLQKTAEQDPKFSASMHRYCRARDAFAMASLCFIDENFSKAWKYTRQSLVITPKPIVGSLRRLGVTVLLVLSCTLPEVFYRSLFSNVTRLAFRQAPGRPFPK